MLPLLTVNGFGEREDGVSTLKGHMSIIDYVDKNVQSHIQVYVKMSCSVLSLETGTNTVVLGSLEHA